MKCSNISRGILLNPVLVLQCPSIIMLLFALGALSLSIQVMQTSWAEYINTMPGQFFCDLCTHMRSLGSRISTLEIQCPYGVTPTGPKSTLCHVDYCIVLWYNTIAVLRYVDSSVMFSQKCKFILSFQQHHKLDVSYHVCHNKCP